MTSRLVVDDRYGGMHGIGRYAHEVLARLQVPWTSLGASGSPTALTDVRNAQRRQLGATDVLYSPGYAVGPTAALQVPTVHDLIHIRQPRRGKAALHRLYYERVLKPTIKRNGHVITVSQTTADDVRAWIDDDSVAVHVSGNGCSAVFRPDGEKFTAARPYALFVGNFKPHKNPAVVFEAMARVHDLDLVVVTSDTTKAADLAESHQMNERLTVLSDVSDAVLAEIYRGSSVLVFPSLMEGFGLPVVEALRCGTPVVYFAGCASVVEICGASQFPVSDHHDAEAFAASISSAVSTPFAPPDLDRYTWEHVAASVDSILGPIVAAHV